MTYRYAEPILSAEEAVADILVSEECLTASEAPDFIEELAKRGYMLAPYAKTNLFGAASDLLTACEDFVRKVERGEARSKRSYSQMKAAIEKATRVDGEEQKR